MKKLVVFVIIAILAIVLFYIGIFSKFYQQIYRPKNGIFQITASKTTYNILLLGYGGGKHDGAYLTDSLMVAHIDLAKKKVVLISLPRDLWTKIPTKSGAVYHSKINAVYQMELFPENYPDVNNPKVKDKVIGNLLNDAVHEITGLTIDNTISVDFSGFKKAIDALGGIDVQVDKAFDDYRYPLDGKENDLCENEEIFKLVEKFITPPYDEAERTKLFKEKPELETFVKNINDEPQLAFPCRYEHLHFDKGLVHMDGETALKYVRSRYGLQDGSDFGRAARQQRFVQAVKDKVISVGFITRIPSVLDSVKDNITIDFTPTDIKKFIAEAPSAKKYTIVNFLFSDEDYLTDSNSYDGQYILIPKAGIDKWMGIKTAIQNTILGITPTPSIKVKPTKF